MLYFTQRNGLRTGLDWTETVNSHTCNFILHVCEKYYIYLAWKFFEACPKYPSVCCGFNREEFYKTMEFMFPNLLFDVSKITHATPKQKKYNQYLILDFIEYMARHLKDTELHYDYSEGDYYQLKETDKIFPSFREDINQIFESAQLLYILTEEKIIERMTPNSILSKEIVENISIIQEDGIKHLLQEAISLFRQPHPNSRKIAVEKIWDALERLKTYYLSDTIDKKVSIRQIITDMSNNQQEFFDLFNMEFETLTKIGNKFTIRHHETNKTDITDLKHYDYFFNRCLSLIALVIQYLK